jgi:hypothetical protein
VGGPPELLGRAEEAAAGIDDPEYRARALVSVVQAGGPPELLDAALTPTFAQLADARGTGSWFERLLAAIRVLRDCDLLDVIGDVRDAVIEIDRDFFGGVNEALIK